MMGLQPSSEKVKDQEAEITRITRLNELIQGKVDKIKSDEDSDEALQEAVSDSLPEGDHTDQLVLDLKSIGESSYAHLRDVGFTLSEMNENDRSSGRGEAIFSNIKEVKMSAKLEGGYTEIRQWMKQLQQLPRLVSIDSFSFSQPYEQRDPGSIFMANVSFTAYYYLE
jgi:type IV pilus assembly protein PilO